MGDLLWGHPHISIKPPLQLTTPKNLYYLREFKYELSASGTMVCPNRVTIPKPPKKKTRKTAIRSAFLKSNTHVHDLTLKGIEPIKGTSAKPVKIRFEVDTIPPGNFDTEELLLLQPFSFYVKCFRLPDLFAGKLHALLYRSWKNRVKGRDWYDFEWYVRHGHPISLKHFLARAQQTGAFEDVETLTIEMLHQALHKRVDEVDFQQAKADVKPFLSNVDGLDFWSDEYFHQLVSKVAAVNS